MAAANNEAMLKTLGENLGEKAVQEIIDTGEPGLIWKKIHERTEGSKIVNSYAKKYIYSDAVVERWKPHMKQGGKRRKTRRRRRRNTRRKTRRKRRTKRRTKRRRRKSRRRRR